jgi:hypothetical protein
MKINNRGHFHYIFMMASIFDVIQFSVADEAQKIIKSADTSPKAYSRIYSSQEKIKK